MSLDYISGKSKHLDGIGDIFPIKIKDYDEFDKCSSALYYTKQHFQIEEEYPLLTLLISLRDDKLIKDLEKLFSLVTQKEVFFISTENIYGFVIDEEHMISADNYDEVRKVIMKQNLMFEQKVYKDELVRKWVEKAMKARSKNAVEVGIEDMLTTIHVVSGISYDKLMDYTIYQLQASFNRISKIKGYDTNIAFKCAGAEKINLDYFAEKIDMFKSPYDDILKKKEDKLSNLNQAFN
jgi:hypothetical protein